MSEKGGTPRRITASKYPNSQIRGSGHANQAPRPLEASTPEASATRKTDQPEKLWTSDVATDSEKFSMAEKEFYRACSEMHLRSKLLVAVCFTEYVEDGLIDRDVLQRYARKQSNWPPGDIMLAELDTLHDGKNHHHNRAVVMSKTLAFAKLEYETHQKLCIACGRATKLPNLFPWTEAYTGKRSDEEVLQKMFSMAESEVPQEDNAEPWRQDWRGR